MKKKKKTETEVYLVQTAGWSELGTERACSVCHVMNGFMCLGNKILLCWVYFFPIPLQKSTG